MGMILSLVRLAEVPPSPRLKERTVDLTYHDCLPADKEEDKRLRVQHEVILRTQGNILIHVPLDLNVPDISVLESGTGSGIWLLDLAGTVSKEAELIGIDIQTSLFPSSGVPSNVTFQVTSILSLPSSWSNKFSLIHQRLLFVAFTQSEWMQALQNIYSCLKPGGWLQMFEVDKWVKAGPMLQMFTPLWKGMLESRGIYEIWPHGSRTWKKLIEEIGFINVQVSWYETPVGKWAGKDGVNMKEDLKGLMKATREAAIDNDGFGVIQGGEEGYDKWMRDTEREVDEGKTEPKVRWVMICASKPCPSSSAL